MKVWWWGNVDMRMNSMHTQENIEIKGNISLKIRDTCINQNEYASNRIQKGLLLSADEKDLSEEGIGFGVPILKFKHKAIFPGSARITTSKDGDKTTITVDYDLNLVERIAVKGNRIHNRNFYSIMEYISLLHREYPRFREMIMRASNTLRRFIDIETRFEEVTSFGIVRVLYVIHAENIHISVDTKEINKYEYTEIILMNEQGARYFDIYRDSNGTFLKENSIGTWDETFADEVYFIDTIHGIEFMLQKVDCAKMFRGRERVPGRLSWSGIAYSLSSDTTNFTYHIQVRC